MRQRVAASTAGIFFTVVIPTVIGMMIPEISLIVGAPIIAISALGGVAVCLWGFWPEIRAWRKPSESESTTPPEPEATPVDQTRLFIECFPEPRKPLEGGRAWVLAAKAVPPDEDSGGLQRLTAFGSTQITLPGGNTLFRCIVRNYGTATLLAVSIELEIRFHAAIHRTESNGRSIQSGAEIFRRPWPIRISRLDPGPDNGFEFYMVGNSKDFVNFKFPASATGQRVDRDKAELLSVTTDESIKLLIISPDFP